MSTPGFEKDAAFEPEAPPLPPFSSSSVVGRAIADVVCACGVTLLPALPVILVWLTPSKGDKATLSARTLPFGLIAEYPKTVLTKDMKGFGEKID